MPRERYTPQEQAYYQKYLSSPQWRAKKKRRIAAAGYQCEFVSKYPTATGEDGVRCHRTNYLCVHHNTYERLGDERLTDLDVYCWFHHMLEHLLWKRCTVCAEPCLGADNIAERWLEATLLQMNIDLETGKVPWKALPTKEHLSMQIHPICLRCRGVQFEKP